MLRGFPKWHVCILIPARNEEALLPRCLKSVQACIRHTDAAMASIDVVVAVDSSIDGSFDVASRFLRGYGTAIRTSAGNVGRARRQATDLALLRYGGNLKRCWLANTDADSSVPLDWVTSQLRLAEEGADAVAGIVGVDSYDEHDAIVESRFHETYQLYSDGTHPHVHGANLGVRADLYCLAGGWRELATAEDWDLWNRLEAVGARRKSCSQVSVLTSGRIIGRAPNGFAAALAAHNPVLTS